MLRLVCRQEGQIEAVYNMAFVCHHPIRFTREASTMRASTERRIDEQTRRDMEDEERAKNKSAKGRSKLREVVDDKHVQDAPNDDRRNISLDLRRRNGLYSKHHIQRIFRRFFRLPLPRLSF